MDFAVWPWTRYLTPLNLRVLICTSKRTPYSRFDLSNAEQCRFFTSLVADPLLLLMRPESEAGFTGAFKSTQ